MEEGFGRTQLEEREFQDGRGLQEGKLPSCGHRQRSSQPASGWGC